MWISRSSKSTRPFHRCGTFGKAGCCKSQSLSAPTSIGNLLSNITILIVITINVVLIASSIVDCQLGNGDKSLLQQTRPSSASQSISLDSNSRNNLVSPHKNKRNAPTISNDDWLTGSQLQQSRLESLHDNFENGHDNHIARFFMKRAAPDSPRRGPTLAKRPKTTTTTTERTISRSEENNKETEKDTDDGEDDRQDIETNKKATSGSKNKYDDSNEEKSDAGDEMEPREKKASSDSDQSDDYVIDKEEESLANNKKGQNNSNNNKKTNEETNITKKPQKNQKSSSPPSKTQKQSPAKQQSASPRQPNKIKQDRDNLKKKIAEIEKATNIENDQSGPSKSPGSNKVSNKNAKATSEDDEIDAGKGRYDVEDERAKNNDDKDDKGDNDDDTKGSSPRNGGVNTDDKSKSSRDQAQAGTSATNITRKTLGIKLPFIKTKNASACTPEAYREFPRDLIGDYGRARGLVVIHIAVVCYMFYSLALVCEKYFMPSLEEFSQRLNLSPDVAGATLMSAGSSAPELFTAVLGVFIAKGDVGTGAIVGSAVFNILFVIGVCAFVCKSPTQLSWWPVLRDSVYYSITVLVLLLFIYDERVTAVESFIMMALYGVYILIMSYNDYIRVLVTNILLSNPNTAKLISSTSATNDAINNSLDDVFNVGPDSMESTSFTIVDPNKTIEEDSMFLAACLIIIQHKRLFRSQLRFRAAAHYIIIKRQHRIQQVALRQQKQLQQQQMQQHQQQLATNRSDEVNYFGPENEPLSKDKAIAHKQRIEAYANSTAISKNKFSIVSRDDYEFWNRPPEEGENYYLWLAKIPVNYVLHYTIPDCVLYPDKYIISFFMSIFWTAFFSYINVWMVTLIGYTFGIPDSVMGFTFLAAGTSVPDCYSSIHAAKNGMANMAVSNSIGSNVFDILIGLAVPWFIQSAIYPGVTATINSRGIVYSVVLLLFSIIVTIYLMHKYEWTLKPRLGLALLIAYMLFIALACMLEFNLFGFVNPPPCKP